MNGFRSSGISSSDFNAKAKALSERLGPVGRPDKPAPRPRQKWGDRSRGRPEDTKAADEATPAEPAEDATDAAAKDE